MSFRGLRSSGNLNLVDYFPPGSQAFQVKSWTLFHHEIVIRFGQLPERSRHLLVVGLFHHEVVMRF